MREYFTWSNLDKNDKYYLCRYYVGIKVVKYMMDIGYDFAKLTTMPSEVIWEKYRYYKSL